MSDQALAREIIARPPVRHASLSRGQLGLAGAALLSCLARDPACLPPQHAHFLPLIVSTVRQESAAKPYVVRNEAEGRGHYFPSWEDAVAYAITADAPSKRAAPPCPISRRMRASGSGLSAKRV